MTPATYRYDKAKEAFRNKKATNEAVRGLEAATGNFFLHFSLMQLTWLGIPVLIYYRFISGSFNFDRKCLTHSEIMCSEITRPSTTFYLT